MKTITTVILLSAFCACCSTTSLAQTVSVGVSATVVSPGTVEETIEYDLIGLSEDDDYITIIRENDCLHSYDAETNTYIIDC